LDNVDDPLVSADGQPAFMERPVFPVQISVSNEKFSLLELLNHSHFKVLRNKLNWG